MLLLKQFHVLSQVLGLGQWVWDILLYSSSKRLALNACTYCVSIALKTCSPDQRPNGRLLLQSHLVWLFFGDIHAEVMIVRLQSRWPLASVEDTFSSSFHLGRLCWGFHLTILFRYAMVLH